MNETLHLTDDERRCIARVLKDTADLLDIAEVNTRSNYVAEVTFDKIREVSVDLRRLADKVHPEQDEDQERGFAHCVANWGGGSAGLTPEDLINSKGGGTVTLPNVKQ